MIEALSYVGFTSPNAAEWTTFGPEILGAELADAGADDAVRLRIDDASWRIAIHPGERDDVAYIGWAVDGPDALVAAIDRLKQAGLEVHQADLDLLAERVVQELIWFIDPFGLRHEISWGLLIRPATFRAGRAMSGFLTGSGGMGHVVLFMPDRGTPEQFFTEVLGMRISDRVSMGPVAVSFLHCNPRHHSLAFIPIPDMVGLHHLMLEVTSIDDVGCARDLCMERGVPITMDLGRHTNDRMTSFYLRTPSGFDVEYGWGGAVIDDATWVAASYDAISIWGHKPPAGQEPLPPAIIRPVDEVPHP